MSVHVGMKSANMLSCGSQRAEASSPFKQRLPGIIPQNKQRKGSLIGRLVPTEFIQRHAQSIRQLECC